MSRAAPLAIRWLYLALGWVSLALAVAGLILPMVPATPFVLLALGAFSRSSPRLERWLLAHPHLGRSTRAWKAHRVISWPAKLVAWVSMAATLAYLIGWQHAAWWIVIAAAVPVVYVSGYIARCPSAPPVDGVLARSR